MSRIYSPSDTEKHLQCPRLRQLDKHWTPRERVWTPNMALGTAIHAGLACWYGPLALEHANNVETFAVRAALDSMASEYVDGSEYTLEACNALVEKGLTEALTVDLVGANTVVGVELEMPHMRMDLLIREPEGLHVIDYKVTLKMDKGKQLPYRILDYDPSWQLLQYPWGVREYMGETVVKSSAFLIILTPRPFTYLHTLPISDERLDDFAHSAHMHWSIMDQIDNMYDTSGAMTAPMNTRSCHAYGRPCDFYDACHVFHGDQSMFPTLYAVKEPRLAS